MEDKTVHFRFYDLTAPGGGGYRKIPMIESELNALKELGAHCHCEIYHSKHLRKHRWIEEPDITLLFTAYKGHVVALSIYSQNTKTLPEVISEFTQLLELFIIWTMPHGEKAPLESLPSGIGRLKNLRVFEVNNYKNLTHLPNTIGNLSSLKKLNVLACGLQSIPASIGGLKRLEKLSFWANRIKELPRSIGDLHSLSSLSLGENELASLPDSIGNLTHLRHLYISKNNLTSIPQVILDLPSLEIRQ